MSTKHFVTNIDKLVVDALEALTLTNPDVLYYKADKVIAKKSHNPQTHVAVLSGGGAGHEPAHAAFVGEGMLTAAASGWIFASPSVAQIERAIVTVAGPKGVLLIIKNYTGDIFHFSLAAEKARSRGIPAEVVVVGDDVAVGRTKSGKVGRRGLAGTVLVHKVAGAVAASAESTLGDVVAAAKEVAENLVTVGVSLNHVHIPGRKIEEENIMAEDEAELGLGIHNEKGCIRLKPIPSLPDLVKTMLDQLTDRTDADRAYVDFATADNVVLMINNLGGLSPLELGAITNEVVGQLTSRRLRPTYLFSGTYMTSLDGPGFSITLLKASDTVLGYLDVPTKAVGFTPGSVVTADSPSRVIVESVVQTTAHAHTNGHSKPTILDPVTFISCVKFACEKVIAAEPLITQYDTVVGDGDCGYTMRRAAEAVLSFVTSSSDVISPTVTTVLDLAETVENNMDGTSGAIFSIYLHALATAVSRFETVLDENDWGTAAAEALKTLYAATPARPGDRTLIDALAPFVDTLASGKGVKNAAVAGRKGAEGTKGMNASLGRAVYVDAKGYDRVPDPGAVGIAELVEGLAGL
ncbi:Dak1 domain-containing protein [Lipomyces kononenkoae]|uniref:Dak1 domain-containing protein n=1 Tax=Lipomyces kononenkoae TaxID=34357 RepID=A0ACC3SWR0_LIPKO